MERTLFTLDWIDDPELRRTTGQELNKGEARNSLARAVFLHRLGEIRDRPMRTSSTAPPASTWSSPQSSYGTPDISSAPSSHSARQLWTFRMNCWRTSPRSVGSTST